MISLSAQEHTYLREMWGDVTKQESSGALERASGVRGHWKALALMMLGQECLTLTKRMMLIAQSETSRCGKWKP